MRRRALLGSCTLRDLPMGYTQLLYVESDGTNYVDTGVIGKSGLSCDGVMSWTVLPNDGNFIGARAGSTTRIYLLHYYKGLSLGYGMYYTAATPIPETGYPYRFQTSLFPNEQTLTWDGEVIVTSNIEREINTNYSLYIFGLNYDGALAFPTKARLYSLKIWQDGELLRDYIPAINKEGIYGLWDIVNKTFSTSTGSPLTGA